MNAMFKAYQENRDKLTLDNISPAVQKSYNEAIFDFIPNIDNSIGKLFQLNMELDFAPENKIDLLFKTVVEISLGKMILERFYTLETRYLHLQDPTYIEITDNPEAQEYARHETLEMIKQFLSCSGGMSSNLSLSFMDILPIPQSLASIGSFFTIPIIDTFCNNLVLEDINNLKLPLYILARDGYLKNKNWLMYAYTQFKYLNVKAN